MENEFGQVGPQDEWQSASNACSTQPTASGILSSHNTS